MRDRMTAFVLDLQSQIISSFEALEPNLPWKRDRWTRKEGGMGISGVVSGGSVLEKAGVNISVVYGMLPPAAIKSMRADHSDIPYDPENPKSLPFFACGISLVIHPRNPHAPTVHANYRYFEISEKVEEQQPPPKDDSSEGTVPATAPPKPPSGKVLSWWFGGGCDLTPSYLYEEDGKHFHTTLKEACDPHGPSIYPSFKKWCDEYFYIPHRHETRGIGGIFFDDLSHGPHKRLEETSPSTADAPSKRPHTPEEIFGFIRSCGGAFVPSYLPILQKRMSTPSTEEQRRWQLLRRGRYVEFNLVYDRGTKFGLNTPSARIESILMSLPETARWEYMSEMGTLEGSEENKLLLVLKTPREWI
ncbi:coproporphyrinogen III oxidase [Clavulina sp. PMI_390]|nr:coproporphyrinogen III oxidase [Clavulina sp. PMI_390]